MTAERREILRLENMERHGFGPNAMKKMKVCRLCGTAASGQDTVCKTCGANLPQETVYQQYKERHLYCRRCDTVVSFRARYCPQCGLSLQMYRVPLTRN